MASNDDFIYDNYSFKVDPKLFNFCKDRLVKTQDGFLCKSCGLMPYLPMSCENDHCSKTYCSSCTEKMRHCDCKSYFKNIQNREMMIFEEFEVKCRFFDLGCKEILKIKNCEKHENNECSHRILKCNWCGNKVYYLDAKNHFERCEKVKVECEYGCGVSLGLEEINDHSCIVSLSKNIENQSKIIETLKLQITEMKYEVEYYRQNTNINIKADQKNFNEFLKLGIQPLYNICLLIKDGFKLIYNRPYKHYSNMLEIKKALEPYKKTVVCIGGNKKGEDHLIIGAFGMSDAIFEETNSLKKAVKKGEIYWHYIKNLSFGFSDTELIAGYQQQEYSDSEMIWSMDNKRGGCCLGSFANLDTSSDFEKKIFVLDINL